MTSPARTVPQASNAPDIATRRLLSIAIGLPVGLLCACWIWLAIEHGSPTLSGVIVHENGVYTMRETVLYASHFLREIPVDIAMSLFAVAAFDSTVPMSGRPHERRVRLAWLAATCAALVVAWALWAASRAHGIDSALLDLAQFRTRDTVSAYGSHWHYHALSTLWFAIAAPVAAALLAALSGLPVQRRRVTAAWRAAWVSLLLPTLLFGVSALSVTSVRYTGHQARELLTHVPITLPLMFATVVIVRGSIVPAGAAVRLPMPTRILAALRASPWRTALALAIPVFLAVRTLAGDPMAEGQSEGGLVAMVAAHVFEHTLDYLFSMLSTVAAACLLARDTG